MSQPTTCLYCGMEGTIIPLPYADLPTLWHAHQCGTYLFVHPQTGEVYQGRTKRSAACYELERLQEDMRLLALQVHSAVHAENGTEEDDL